MIRFACDSQHSVNDLAVIPLRRELRFPRVARAVTVATACLVTVKDVRPPVPDQPDVRYRRAIRVRGHAGELPA